MSKQKVDSHVEIQQEEIQLPKKRTRKEKVVVEAVEFNDRKRRKGKAKERDDEAKLEAYLSKYTAQMFSGIN